MTDTTNTTSLRERLLACVPNNWCDPLLTGPGASKTPLDCPGVERLLAGVRARIEAELSALSPPPPYKGIR